MMKRATLVAAVMAVSAFSFLNASRTSLAAPTTAPAGSRASIPALDATAPVEFPGLHNVVTYTDELVCGGVPEGEAGFKAMYEMGIKTVISVDGALPDLELAKKYGMRYVHLPIGYNGFDDDRAREIARAVRDLPKPIYLHCHHGKHRSAGASGAAAVLLGWMSPEQGLAKLKVSGTAANYTGLYNVVRQASPAQPGELDEASDAFPEQWKPSGMVETMVEIDEVTDKLKLIEKANWQVPATHPDLVPAAEAGRLADHYRLMLEDDSVKAEPQDFRDRLISDLKRLSEIEEGLLNNLPPAELSARFKLVLQSCKDCHAAHRDLEAPAHRELP